MRQLDATPKIYFGRHSLDALRRLPEGPVALICDPFMVESGIYKHVTDRLEQYGRKYSIFSEVKPDPSIETVAACMQMVFKDKPEVLIALGGGSAMDTTKAALFCCLRYKESLTGRQHVHKPYFVAVPTTSGTGSEVTSYTVITDLQQEVKIPISHRSMIPDMAILDPKFTSTLPKEIVGYTGMDVMTHAIEAYVSPNSNSFTDMYAMQAAKDTRKYLPRMFEGDTGVEACQQMMIASTLAGLAFNNSGLGVCHGMAHTVGAEFHLPHGKANSILLPWSIAFNAGLGSYRGPDCESSRQRYGSLAGEMGGEPTAEGLIAIIQELNRILCIAPSLKENGIDREDFYRELPSMADRVVADMTSRANPRPVSKHDAMELLKAAYEGKLYGDL